jgi:hypothetical protein
MRRIIQFRIIELKISMLLSCYNLRKFPDDLVGKIIFSSLDQLGLRPS